MKSNLNFSIIGNHFWNPSNLLSFFGGVCLNFDIEDSMVPPPFTGGRGDESLMFRLKRGGPGAALEPPV